MNPFNSSMLHSTISISFVTKGLSFNIKSTCCAFKTTAVSCASCPPCNRPIFVLPATSALKNQSSKEARSTVRAAQTPNSFEKYGSTSRKLIRCIVLYCFRHIYPPSSEAASHGPWKATFVFQSPRNRGTGGAFSPPNSLLVFVPTFFKKLL